jgi:hypothetical protein
MFSAAAVMLFVVALAIGYSYLGSEKMDNTAKVEGSATTGLRGTGQSTSPAPGPRTTNSNVPPANQSAPR